MAVLNIVKKKLRGVLKRFGLMDDFDWSNYNEQEYARQINNLEKEHTFVIPEGKFKMEAGKIILNSDLLPLHENHKLLYETIYGLNPASVLEVGCGGGDHLANIKKILPAVQLQGSDLLQTQLDFLGQRHPELKNMASLFLQDLTSADYKIVEADAVYTQAVLMHIRRPTYYRQALKNIFSSAKNWVVLMEHWGRRDYVKDIKKLSEERSFPWQKIYFYKNGGGRHNLLIVSKLSLSQFPKIENNKELIA